MEYREIFLTLLRKYDETKQPQSYLKDLVESTHLFLRMLEHFCKGRKNLMVQVSDTKQPLKLIVNTTVIQKAFSVNCINNTNQFL